MNATTSCKYCGQNVEYENDLANVTIECPDCCRPFYLPKYITLEASVLLDRAIDRAIETLKNERTPH